MARPALGLAVVLLGGCVQIFDLEGPSHADEDNAEPTPMDDDPSGGGSESTCPGVVASGRCFERFYEAAGWDEAAITCDSFGYRLAKLETAAIRTAVGKLLSLSAEVYIGGNDAGQNGQYVWIDGTLVLEEGWMPSQPDFEIDELCMTIQNAGAIGMLDAKCKDPRDFICEYAID